MYLKKKLKENPNDAEMGNFLSISVQVNLTESAIFILCVF